MRALRWLRTAVLPVVALTSCDLGSDLFVITPIGPEPEWQIFYAPGADYSFPASRLVVRSASEWEPLWATLTARVDPKPASPSIDFSWGMLAVAALGTKGSGGHSIEIMDVETIGNSMLRVTVRETSPGSNCATAAALTNPVVVIRVPPADSVEFVTTKRTIKC